MNKFILLLFFIWIGWKVFEAIAEEIRSRLEKGPPGETPPRRIPDVKPAQKAKLPGEQPLPRSFPESHEPARRYAGRPARTAPEDEIERLFREGATRKREMSRPARKPPLANEPTYPEKAEVRREGLKPVLRRQEPLVERPHPARTEKQRVVLPQEPPPAAAGQWQPPTTPAVTKTRIFRKKPARETREVPPLAELLGLAEWDIHEIRRGIILAEILGAPKAFREIDPHVI